MRSTHSIPALNVEPSLNFERRATLGVVGDDECDNNSVTQRSNVSMNSNANQTNPTEFQQYLRSLIAQAFSGNPQDNIPDADRGWGTVILGLSDNFCASFLLPSSITWNTLKEKITILETCLWNFLFAIDCSAGIITRLPGPYALPVAILFRRLIHFSTTFSPQPAR